MHNGRHTYTWIRSIEGLVGGKLVMCLNSGSGEEEAMIGLRANPDITWWTKYPCVKHPSHDINRKRGKFEEGKRGARSYYGRRHDAVHVRVDLRRVVAASRQTRQPRGQGAVQQLPEEVVLLTNAGVLPQNLPQLLVQQVLVDSLSQDRYHTFPTILREQLMRRLNRKCWTRWRLEGLYQGLTTYLYLQRLPFAVEKIPSEHNDKALGRLHLGNQLIGDGMQSRMISRTIAVKQTQRILLVFQRSERDPSLKRYTVRNVYSKELSYPDTRNLQCLKNSRVRMIITFSSLL